MRATSPAFTAQVPGAATAGTACAATINVYHCASQPYSKWPELFPALTCSTLGAAESSGAKLVFADNVYAYGPVGGPLREDLPANARGRKGRIRAEMASQLLGAYRDGRARMVIGRASDYYGPRGTGSVAGETLFGRIMAPDSERWPEILTQLSGFTLCDQPRPGRCAPSRRSGRQ